MRRSADAVGSGLRTLLGVALLLAASCQDAPVPAPDDLPTSQGDPAPVAEDPAVREEVFDREFLFLSTSVDSVVQIPWLFRTRSREGGALRERQVWLSQDGSWEVLAQETSETPEMRAPWRILPGERVRIVVGDEDRIESLVVRDARTVETWIGELLAEWVRTGGEPILLHRSQTVFPSGPVDGLVLDLTRRWNDPADTPGDWLFVHAGTELQFFLEEHVPLEDPRDLSRHRGWSRMASQDGIWSNLTMIWEEMRPFERARRDIPARWTFSSPGGEVRGSVVSVSSHLTAGEGEGPILPVSGLFEVTGTLTIQGEEHQVSGMVRHVQH